MSAARRNPDEPPILSIGLMSGTSADGIDGAVLSLSSNGDIAIESTIHLAFPPATRKKIEAVITRSTIALDDLGRLHTELGELYAMAADGLMESVGERVDEVAVIGCHGQTVRHRPDGEFPFSLQLCNGAVVAQRTGIPVVTDFRSADLAEGGQGAPLAPVFHMEAFSDRRETRAIVNLGGIANVTHLPADSDAITGFDTGPANTLLDYWCRRHFDALFDRDGALAAGGTVQRELLDALLADSYFARPPPKSTGREYFNAGWLERHLADNHFAAVDVLATLTALTAETIAAQLKRLTPAVDAVYVCGGGAHNKTLLTMLGERCGRPVATTAELGVDPQWVEAAAFAWLAFNASCHLPATLTEVTGAANPTVTGAIYFPNVFDDYEE